MILLFYNYRMVFTKEQISEYNREYYQKNKEKIFAHRKENWTYINKEYRREHPEIIRMANKRYYEKNRERLLAKAKEKYASRKW